MLTTTEPAPLEIDEELLERFGGRGPRYTSYPTADRFHDRFTHEDYDRALMRRADRRDEPLGLYVHVPFCRTICWYCACNKIGTKHQEQSSPYLEALLKELWLLRHRIGTGHRVSHLHFGGGTPTFMPDAELGRLIAAFRETFDFAPDDDGEYSIEIDPRTVDAARLRVLRGLGMNRVSLGVQDFDPEVQKAVNRIQPRELTVALIEAARDSGFRSVNVDLIYGLPRQTPDRFRRTVEQTIAAGPDRIALYHYAHLPTLFKPQRRIAEADLPSSADKGRMFEEAVRLFEAAGYRYLGLDHFAKADDELAIAQREGRLHRNFQGYTSHDPGDLIALGVSAIASVGDVYAQNDKLLQGYYEALAADRLPVVRGIRLNREDFIRRDAIQSLMCRFELDWGWLARRRGVDGPRHFARELASLAPLVDAGAVRIDATGVAVLPRGRLLVRAVAMAFDEYLGSGSRPAGGYSRIA
ncbi:oxygen-independent coproporphyrinogen III oxidase [Burkholderiaceae bacterium FT117]|uniref:oxygen-independent coproporphyrinogen III oxidase n=1 Tax=Zeimonas sediminis TaxID=2944268 RepID=UPI002342E750|nr:oxygen-independent coproporphyrinogen III oxidase [Zeimonas sediminis]MCM5570262.1 oxygen-independent coproporphyrinogen III oxidase [Zeimonas sediminis]